MAIRLTESKLRQIIREELRKGVNESDGRGKDAPHDLVMHVKVKQRRDPEEERSAAVMDALADASEDYGASYDIVDAPDKADRKLPGYEDGVIRGEPHNGMVPYTVYIRRFPVKRPISDQK